MPLQKLITTNDTSYLLELENISDFLSQSFILFNKVEHMDELFEEAVAFTKDIISHQISHPEVPPAKIHKMEEKFERYRAMINQCKVEKYDIQEEDTRINFYFKK